MLRFTPKKRAKNYFSRKEQRKLLTLVLLLGGMVVLISYAADPSSWAWFALLANDQAPPLAAAEDQPIDTRLARRIEADEPGIIRAEAPRPAEDNADVRRLPQVDVELLRSIRDDTTFRGDEHAAFYHLLSILKDSPQDSIHGASTGHVSFTQLFRQPGEYRGELVTVRGTVHTVELLQATKNSAGIVDYFRVGLEPVDQANPIIIYLLELPPEFPTGRKLGEPAEITGFFFKRWAYGAGDGIRVAPLLLAKTIDWKPEAKPEVVLPSRTKLLAIASGIVVIVSLLLALLWQRRQSRTLAILQAREDVPQRIASLAGLETKSVTQRLQQLEQATPSAEPPDPAAK